MDEQSRLALGRILNVSSFSETQWIQATLPISKGGLGLTSSLRSIIPAFVGSLGLTLEKLVELESTVWPSSLKGIFSDRHLQQWNDHDKDLNTWHEYICQAQDLYAQGAQSAEIIKTLKAPKPLYRRYAGQSESAIKKREKRMAAKKQAAEEAKKQDAPPPFAFPTTGHFYKKAMPYLQRISLRSHYNYVFLELFKSAADRDKRRLLSVYHGPAGGFLSASVVRFDTRLQPVPFVNAVRYRLGIQAIEQEKLRPTDVCLCGKSHDWSATAELLCCTHISAGIGFGKRHDYPKLTLAQIMREAQLPVRLEKVVGKGGRNYRVDVTSDAFPVIDDENEVIGTCHVHFDLAVTCEQSGTNLTRSCLQGMAASSYAAKKIREAGEKDIVLQEPDRFLPAIMETAGFMHGDLRAALYDIAIRHVDISVTDTALSKEQRHSLIGITLSGYYQRMSVALMKGVNANIQRAVKLILVHNGRSTTSSSLTNGRAHLLVSGSDRRKGAFMDHY